MNAFANWLFSVLLGWTGTFANGIWNTVMNESGGISDFFSRFWLPLVLILIIGGTVLDYAVWFIRWRPYLVWRSWFNRQRRQREARDAEQMLDATQMDEQIMSTIADWVQTPHDQSPVYGMEVTPHRPREAMTYAQPEAGYPPWQPQQEIPQPAWQPAPSAEPLPYQAEYFSANQPAWESGAQQPSPIQQPAEPAAAFDTLEEYWDQAGYTEPDSLQPAPAPSSRRRRSQRPRERATGGRFLTDLRDRITQRDPEETMLDGLPAPVRQEDAFHEAVYPQGYHYQDPEQPRAQRRDSGQPN